MIQALQGAYRMFQSDSDAETVLAIVVVGVLVGMHFWKNR